MGFYEDLAVEMANSDNPIDRAIVYLRVNNDSEDEIEGEIADQLTAYRAVLQGVLNKCIYALEESAKVAGVMAEDEFNVPWNKGEDGYGYEAHMAALALREDLKYDPPTIRPEGDR